jgi:HK97 family phage major capsid protein
MSKKVITPMQIIAADSNSRTISGRIVTFEETGNASIGKVQFAQGSIEPTSVLLNLEHDRTRRIGKTLSIYATKQGIDATFKIAETTAGNDALVEAQEGLRDGFSVEVMFDEYETMDDGTVRILKGELTGVALTSEPAIRSARVESVAATEEDQISDSTIEPESTTTEGDEVEDTVKDASTAETVEAAQSVTAAAKPAALASPLDSQRVRTPIVNKATYLEHSVRATLGNEQSKLYVAAAADTTDNAGLVPTRQLTEVINGISNADRPFISSISTGALPDAGMTFEIPKITVAPTVAVASEGGTPSNTDMNSAFISVPVQKFIGQQVFSLEILDRSSPAFFDELVRQMEYAYAKATDAAVGTALITGGTDGGNRAALTTGALVADFVSDAAVSIYKGTLGFAQNIVVSPEQWGALMGLVDNTNRPIFQQTINPQNAGGDLTATAIRGNLLGLNLRVSTALNDTAGLGDNTLIVVNPTAYTWYESPRLQLSTNVINTGQVNVAYYGYGAVATKLGAGAYRYMVS